MKEARDYKKILIYRIGHLGDTLVSLPAIWAIRKAFPGADISLLTGVDSKNANYVVAKDVLPAKGLIDDWIFYSKGNSRAGSAFNFLKLFAGVRRAKFDCVFYLMTRNRDIGRIARDESFFRRAGIREIFGTEYLRQNRIEEPFEKPLRTVESEAEFFINLLPHDRFEFDKNAKPDLLLSNSEKEFAESWLKKNAGEVIYDNKLIAIAPGSKWSSKIWAEENFADVVAQLIDKYDVFPVVFGGREDREVGARLISKWRKGANAAGELNIRQAAAALSHCKFYLGNDTGTMHLAASVGTPCVGIFAAIDLIDRWNPFGAKNIIFRERIECEGCHSPVCPIGNECLNRIKPADVLAACEEILSENKTL
ncbi:MAG: glycosyltransferase family 9 protein [Pyrinomonadaceae bacterium]|nr:glycosyltransferase family 9 protein [Pyrinomonadaceae bacterium]